MQQTTPQAYLIIRHGNRWTDVLRLQPNQKVVIGRASDNQIIVRDERVSRYHAEIYPQDGGWFVRDLGSRNGTAVKQQTISGPTSLKFREIIQVGGCEMVFTENLPASFNTALGRPLRPTERQETVTFEVNEQASATITHRAASSQWSSDDLTAHVRPPLPRAVPESGSDLANFFYRLVFELVRCRSPEDCAKIAIEKLLSQIEVASGGILIQAAGDDESSMALLAAQQSQGGVYHRVSDFLVQTVVRENQALLARNVQDDSHLSLAHASARRETISVICAPIRQRNADRESVIGILHIYSSGEERMLTERDLEISIGVADNLAIALGNQQSQHELEKSLQASRRQIDELHSQLEIANEMVGGSDAMTQVREAIRRAAPSSATVLILGESGVGKELVARAVHAASRRKDGPLVCLNCAALAPTLLESELFGHEKGAFTGATERKIGKFEAANGGTLLLDEIAEMEPELQAKFLRVLEGHSFERLGGNKPITTDVRVIAATNRNLEEAVQAKAFRPDLYYRLRVVEIAVPPLRRRLEDLPELAAHFIAILRTHAGRRVAGISPRALETLARHSWPGNVRELRNVIERAIVLGTNATIEIEDMNLSTLTASEPLGAATSPRGYSPIPLAELEKSHILATLEYTEGNKTRAAQLLGIERSTLDRKLKRY